jgi:transcriptional regulator with XRE-family HTH domain
MGWDVRPRDPQRLRGFAIVGRMIRRKRMWLGWTQRMLGAQAGIDQSVISRLENGRQYGLHWKRFADIAAALDGFDLVQRSRIDALPQRRAHGPPRPAVIDLELDRQEVQQTERG